jgi:hypothetical protein
MAVVGEAHIIVRAITTQVKDDIKRGFSGVDGVINDAGKQIQKTFKNDFAREADGARRAWQRLQKSGFLLQTAIGSIAAAGSSLVSSLGSIVGAAGGAAASLASLSGIIVALPLGLTTAKLALGGVGQAVQQATKAGTGYGKSLREINEELQQLKFDQEEAALSVERAGINLERARENLLRVQDLPVASRARREAELDAREADLALRKAIDRRKDLADELKRAQSGGNGGGGGTDPYAGLLPSQKEFAKFLVSIQGELKKLKAAAANGFLPVLQQQITRLLTNENGVGSFFSVIERGLGIISGALGESVTKFFDSLTQPGNLGKLSRVFDNAGITIAKFGEILGSVYDSFLSITTASNASTQRFLDFLSNKAGGFAEFLNAKQATGELEVFFDRAASLMSELGDIFGNVFGFIGDLIEDNFSPSGVSGGAYLLSWLRQATAGWKTLQERVGESEFNAFLLSAAVNTRAILTAFKPVIKAFAQLGANRNVKETFDALAQGGPALGQIIESGAEAGPIFAELLANLTKILASLADSGAIKVFFGTLNDFAKLLADILENETIRNIVNTIGQIVAFGLALQTLKTIALFSLKIIAGAFVPIQTALVSTGVMAATTGAALQAAFTRFLGPVGIAVGVGTAVYAGLKAISDEATRVKIEALGAQDALLRVGAASDVDGIQLLATAFGDVNGQFEIIKTINGESLNDFDAATENLRFTLQDALTDGDTFKLLLEGINGASSDGVNAINDMNDSTRKAAEQGFKNIGTTLATVAQTNLPLAIQKFKELRDGMGLNEAQGKDLYNLMGDDFKNAIMDAGGAVGVYVDEQEAMNIAFGEGETGAKLLAGGVNGVSEAATKARNEVQRLEDSIFNFGKVQLDVNSAERQFEASLDDLRAALKKNGKTLDITTEAGRSNQEALDGLVRSGLDAANANFELTGSGPELEAALLKLRDETIKGAEAFGASKTEAEKLADQLVGTDYDIKIKVKELTKAEAEAAATKAKETWDAAVSGKTPTLPTFMTDPKTWKGSGIPWLPAGTKKKDGGLIRGFYDGGEVYGPGGPRSDMIPAMLSNGEFVVNAASTEKYLPLLRAINSEGIGGAKLANGGQPGPVINMTVNAAPGMNTSELVNEVSRKIAFELRSGVVR